MRPPLKTTRTQFWNVLAKLKGFRLLTDGSIRRLRIECPVCGVANKLLKKPGLFGAAAFSAAKLIGLDPTFVGEVMEAADSRPRKPEIKRLRAKLIRVTGAA